jgi:hypothetical protein
MVTVKGSMSLKTAVSAAISAPDSLAGSNTGLAGLKQAEPTRANKIPKRNTGFEDFIKNSLEESGEGDKRKRPLTAWEKPEKERVIREKR